MTADAYTHAGETVRDLDPDLAMALLYAPKDKRDGLTALYAFLLEIERTRSVISDPMPGEIRLQWWRDALADAGHGAMGQGDVMANPLAAALLDACARFNIPREPLLAVLDARTFDLYDDPMPSMTDFEGYAGEIWAGPMSLAASILSGESPAHFADAAGHGGVAFATARLLVRFKAWARRGQCFIPMEMCDAAGLEPATIKTNANPDALKAALTAFSRAGEAHLDKAVDALNSAPRAAGTVFLPLVLARGTFRLVKKPSYAPFDTVPQRARWQRMISLWRAGNRWPRGGRL